MTTTDADLRSKVREEIRATPSSGVSGPDPFPPDGSGFYEPFVRDAPETALSYHRYMGALESRSTLELRLLHLIWAGVDALVTHLFPIGARAHAHLAMQHGATIEQVFEVLCMASAVSNRTCEIMAPVLLEECGRAGVEMPGAEASVYESETKQRLVDRDGVWTDAMDVAMRVFPEYYARTLELGHALRSEPTLSAAERALVFLALTSSPPALDVDRARLYARRALELGASPDDLRSAVQSCAGLGAHAFSLGVSPPGLPGWGL